MPKAFDRYVIARESNVLRVDFSREPDPPAPRFPGARGLRFDDREDGGSDCAATPLRLRRARRFKTSCRARPWHERAMASPER